MKTERVSEVTTFVCEDNYYGLVHLVVDLNELEKFAGTVDQTVRNATNGAMVALSVPVDDLKEFVVQYVKQNAENKFDDFIDLLLQ
jgi:uncharacterized protein YkuJ